jgi:hypothetical protein
MSEWRNSLLKTTIIAVMVLIVLAGILVWALLFFRSTG